MTNPQTTFPKGILSSLSLYLSLSPPHSLSFSSLFLSAIRGWQRDFNKKSSCIFFFFCPLHPFCCALLCDSKVSPPAYPPPPSVKGLPSVWKLFLLHSSLPEVQVPSLFFCLRFFFFLLPYPGTWGFSCLLGSLRSSASVQ